MTKSIWTDKASVENVLTTELNAAAAAGRAISTAAISNDAAGERYLYADFLLLIASQSATRTAGPNATLYILPEVNAIYPYGATDLAPQAELAVGSFSFDSASAAARYAVLRGVLLPPSDFHVMVGNNTGIVLADTGNTLVMERYNIEAV